MLFIAALNCVAQADSYLHTRYTVERIASNASDMYSGGIKTLGANTPPGTVGDVYLSGSYNISVFQLYDGDKLVEGYFSKLDLQNNEFDIITKAGVKVLKGNLVKSFIYDDSLTNIRHSFVNALEWKTTDESTLKGFFEILSPGSIILARYTELKFIKADYNAAKHIGSKDHRYVKKEHFYYVAKNVVSPLPKKKELFDIFGDKKVELQKFSDEQNINLKNSMGLERLFTYYNQLVGNPAN